LANPSEAAGHSSGGLTLADMKAAAAEAGLDPALVERAARLLPTNRSAPSSFLARLIGGPFRLGDEAHFPIVLDEPGAAQVLSAVRIEIGPTGEGHAGATGMTWRSSHDFETFKVTARPDQDGTAVTVEVTRGATPLMIGMFVVGGSTIATFIGAGLGGEFGAAVGVPAILGGVGGVLALARGYWASQTRTARERIGRALSSVGHSLDAISGARGAGDEAGREQP
jgi:hypothetical protein